MSICFLHFINFFFAGIFRPVFARSETTKQSNDVHMLPGTSQASKVSLSGVTRQSCNKKRKDCRVKHGNDALIVDNDIRACAFEPGSETDILDFVKFCKLL